MNEMEKAIHDVIYKYTDVNITDTKENLLSDNYKIYYIYFLYVFSELEKMLSKPVFSILETLKYNEFTIAELADRIERL